MKILVYTEISEGEIKKPSLEAASYGYALAQQTGGELVSVAIGQPQNGQLERVKQAGVSRLIHVNDDQLATFVDAAYATALAGVIEKEAPRVVVFPQSYDSKAVAPRVAAKLDAGFIPGAAELAKVEADSVTVRRVAHSTKSFQDVKATSKLVLLSVKPNSFGVEQNPASDLNIETAAYTAGENDFKLKPVERVKAADGISLTEADVVVSAGRGLKGPENWGMMDELAGLLNAGQACSKPVSDVGWRPHHEHVGQTGIQIAPNVYIAVGISGAIQHLAGVSSSKTIIVINKDEEAPFFKAADYGMVADAFDVIPKLNEAVKEKKASA